jgi:hypothetical protein
MKYKKIIFVVFIIISCEDKKSKTIITHKDKIVDSDSSENLAKIDVTDTINFNRAKAYIKENGTIERVDASDIKTKEFIITYYTLDINNSKVIVDHTNRIYMTYGNILKENNTVSAEINYGVPGVDSIENKEKEIKVLETYKELIKLAHDF